MDGLMFIQDVLLLTLYSLTSLIALIGNGLVCSINFKRQNHRLTTNLPLSTTCIFLLNLALADALSGLSIPMRFLFCSKNALEKFAVSSYCCPLSEGIQILASNTSTLMICVIAFDRYRLIRNPLQQYQSRKTRRTILLTWLISGIYSLICLMSMKVQTYFKSIENLISCEILFPSSFGDYIRKTRIFCLVLVFYIVPVVAITVLCILTMKTLAHRSIVGVQQFATFEQTRTRSIRLLIIAVIVFTLTHFPVHLLHLHEIFLPSPIHSTKCHHSTMYLFSHWLSISSCCYNPIIYSWFNREFRTSISKCSRVIVKCKCHPSPGIGFSNT